ncbi:hypothetical protein V6N13_124956 [Hibiscus sabdariffa]
MTKGMPRQGGNGSCPGGYLGGNFRIRQSVTDLLPWRKVSCPQCRWEYLLPVAWAGKSALAGNMPDFAPICRGRFTNSAPEDDMFLPWQVIEPEVEQPSQVVEENSTNLETQPLRRSTRERHEPERYGFLVTTHGDVILVDQDEPKAYQEAVSNPDSEKWLEAIRSEMDSMSENHVWTLVEPPEGIKSKGCKWVFKKKTDMDGNVQTYKGRLGAKGFRQIHGIDYDETSSPVAMIKIHSNRACYSCIS